MHDERNNFQKNWRCLRHFAAFFFENWKILWKTKLLVKWERNHMLTNCIEDTSSKMYMNWIKIFTRPLLSQTFKPQIIQEWGAKCPRQIHLCICLSVTIQTKKAITHSTMFSWGIKSMKPATNVQKFYCLKNTSHTSSTNYLTLRRL